ncbi:MAG: glycosyltransferase [Chloroflexota bacterium]|nr:glycosyltransferase [Chloroflexota bacterium]
MKILQISTKDIGGGAERIAHTLFSAYQARGHESWLAVGSKRGKDRNVIQIPENNANTLIQFRDWLRKQNQRVPGTYRLSNMVDWVVRPRKRRDYHWGIEDFNYSNSRRLLEFVPEKPDIIHAHNLHGGYFDLRYLVELSHQFPMILTLHDEWTLTGHCAYTLGCNRWERGCGDCPDLSIYPGIRRDATAYNWRRKSEIYKYSQLHLATPSHWLMDRVKRSMLQPVSARVIPNGIDLEIFQPPKDRRKVRQGLDIPQDVFVILAVANGWNRFKDYETIATAIGHLSENEDAKGYKLMFVALGDQEDSEGKIGHVVMRKVSYITDPQEVARYYQAVDVFLHAAHNEVWGLTTTEAMACGTPVVATSVGGIPEQIENGETGFLAPKGDASAMAARVAQLLRDADLRRRMSAQAAATARRCFGLDHMVDEYLEWYHDILTLKRSTS